MVFPGCFLNNVKQKKFLEDFRDMQSIPEGNFQSIVTWRQNSGKRSENLHFTFIAL